MNAQVLRTDVHAYNLYVEDSGLSLQEIRETVAKNTDTCKMTTVEQYIKKNYKSEDAARLQAKLGLTNGDVENAYRTVEAWKLKTESTPFRVMPEKHEM